MSCRGSGLRACPGPQKTPKLVIELDGSQHFEDEYKLRDIERDNYLKSLNLHVLRFNNDQVFCSVYQVLEAIYQVIKESC